MKKFTALAAIASLTGCVTAPQQTIYPHQASFFSDPHDRDRANEVLEGGSEDFPVSWVSANGQYTVIPTRTYKSGDQDCREFTASNGKKKIKSSACRRDDGTWQPL